MQRTEETYQLRHGGGQWSFGGVGRVVQPELLDELPFDDPEAVRSRRELRIINGLMGNFAWMRDRLRASNGSRVVELGSGDGALLNLLRGDGHRVAGVDLAPRPDGLADGIEWLQGDAREVLEGTVESGEIVIANHLLHQFKDDQLREIGRALESCAAFFACEPLRSIRARVQGVSLWPLLNRVTRYDMLVSIRAGFRRGELPALLGLKDKEWELQEWCTLRGAYRLSARRRC